MQLEFVSRAEMNTKYLGLELLYNIVNFYNNLFFLQPIDIHESMEPLMRELDSHLTSFYY